MPMSMKERSALGVAARAVNARRRKFLSTAEEMLEHPEDIDGHTPALLAEILRKRGWTVLMPQA